MTRIIVVTSGKGGVGKTTTTSNIGMALATLGSKTVLIDADVGLRNLDLLLGLENRIVFTGADVLSGECKLEQALIKDKRQPNLMLLPACRNQSNDSITKEQLKKLIELVDNLVDFILIDCPAGIEEGFQVAISVATEALIVTTPEIAAVRDADRVIGILDANNIKTVSLILNRIRPKMVRANDMMSVEDVSEILSIPLIGVIPEDECVIISTNRGEPLVINSTASNPGIAFEHTARRVNGEIVEFLDIESLGKNPIKKLLKRFSKP
uniref:Putative septum site-determining protein MinD n=1 Tax=Haptophyceae sp. NIES-3900 TaxID=2748608 RepID=A0A7R7AKB2_9EUKA|nr:septum site-determining protein [Haptophyceae sp. NIES-3900]